MQLTDQEGCATCHAIDAHADYESNYESYAPASIASSFTPVTREDCVECHTTERAGDACLTCHAYHGGAFAQVERFDRPAAAAR